MNKIIALMLILVLFSCKSDHNTTKKEEKLTEIKNKRTAFADETYLDKLHKGRTFLAYKELNNYLINSNTINVNNEFETPFNDLSFDKVIAYDYLGDEESNESVFTAKGVFNRVILKQKTLTEKQVVSLVNTLTNKETYGDTTAACFNPHLAFVFYKNNKSVFVIDICLGCNYLTSTEEIPAMFQEIVNKGKENEYYTNYGFSKKGKSKLIDLCKDLDFFYGKK